SSISANRTSIPTTAAARSASRSSRKPPRRYISTSRPPRSRSSASRAWTSARRSRLSRPACGRRGTTPSEFAIRRKSGIDLECSARGSRTLTLDSVLSVREPLSLDDHETFLGHLADCPGRAFLRVAGRLHAAVGHLVGAERRRLVDRDAAELEALRGLERGMDVAGEDRRLEAIAGRVRLLDRIIEVCSARERDDGAEDLLALHLVVAPRACDHGRSQE